MSSITTQKTLNLHEILHEEDALYEQWQNRSKETLEKIFLAAAQKLENHVDDITTISGILAKRWPKDARRIREYLPNKYKSMDRKHKDPAPLNMYEEFMETIIDAMRDGVEIFKVLYNDYKRAPLTVNEGDEEQKHGRTITTKAQFEELLLEVFASGDLSKLKEHIETWKNISISMGEAKLAQDKRTQISEFYKVLVHMDLFFGTRDSVAKKAGICSKWARGGIENDPRVMQNFNKMCLYFFGVDNAKIMATWFSMNKVRQARNEDGIEPPFKITVEPSETYEMILKEAQASEALVN